MDDYDGVVASLRQAYGPAAAAKRDDMEKEAFKVDERRRFLELLRDRGATSLLEVGAGTGHDSLYFQEQGLRVLCTDLSPAMVELCRVKGLDARVADFLSLGVPPASFDANGNHFQSFVLQKPNDHGSTGQCPARSRGAGASGRGTGQGGPGRSRNRAGAGR